ncbi:hypothetical protein MLD38_028473 [Melastoma candidum]|uniref:Uncharacterized protein n=1 Tax=Melastoma candidum TaxID=119954 RepID=A0ACB9N722_9MYRT|nr:hypothetical protein MLD38_028473 [Melastoma candidum]
MSQPRSIHLLIFFTPALLLLLLLLIIPFHSPHQAVSSDLGAIPSFRRLLSHSLELGNDDGGYDDDEDGATPLKKPPTNTKPTSSSSSSSSSSFTTTPPPPKKNQTLSKVVQSKPDKPTRPTASAFSSKNHTTKAFASSNNSTKPIKPKLPAISGENSSRPATAGGRADVVTEIELKELNSTAAKVSKKLNSTAKAAHLGKKSLDLAAKNPTLEKLTKKVDKELKGLESEKKGNWAKAEKKADPEKKKKIPNKQVSGFDLYGRGVGDTGEDEDDLVAQFRDLPAQFHRTLLPDLERISAASKAYVGKANERIAKNFRPYVGKRYASTAAAAASFTFVVVPLIIVSLIVRHMKDHLSVQRTAVFVQIYLAVYFSILCVSALLTGVEPLRFFDATAHSTYAFLQVVQMVGYMLYLVLLFLYLVRAFTWDIGLNSKLLVLAQVVVGYAIGIHYYVMVFHRAVSHQQPKTSWKVHGVYAACFTVVCCLARAAEHRKKAYLEGEGEGDKQS